MGCGRESPRALRAMRARHANALAEVAAVETALTSAVDRFTRDRRTAEEATTQARTSVQKCLWYMNQRRLGSSGELIGSPTMPGMRQWAPVPEHDWVKGSP